jgi:hypothetical protein
MPAAPHHVLPSGARRRFFFQVRSRERVGVNSEESLFDFNFKLDFIFLDPKSSRSSSP